MSDAASKSLPPRYFEDLYAACDDPWQFETSPYEAAKYATTLAALPRARYHAALEVGCSIGVLTAQLAARCDSLLAVDVSEKALERARALCALLPHVRFARLQIPEQFPSDRFDLILLSEVCYFWSWDGLALARRRVRDQLLSGGHLLLVHWTPPVPDFPLTGDQVHDAFLASVGSALRHCQGQRTPQYRLDLFERI